VIRAVEGPIANVQSAPPESVHYRGKAEHLVEVWIAVRANLRAVLEHTTLADVTSGKLPKTVKQLAARYNVPVDQLSEILAHQLPLAVDHASPDGKLPHTA